MTIVATAPLHLIKLGVGVTSIVHLEALGAARATGRADADVLHITRMVPTRVVELLGGGSLFWVIAGQISARQTLKAIQPFTDDDGVKRCRLVLDRAVVPVLPRPHRVFQGWRYLSDAERPMDLVDVDGATALPEQLRRDLRDLGLL